MKVAAYWMMHRYNWFDINTSVSAATGSGGTTKTAVCFWAARAISSPRNKQQLVGLPHTRILHAAPSGTPPLIFPSLSLFVAILQMAINKRDANKVDDRHDPLARGSVGLVEGKLLAAKVEEAQAKVNAAIKHDQATNLGRASANLGRVSANLKQAGMARHSGNPKGADVEGAAQTVENVLLHLDEARGELDPKVQQEIAPAIEGVREAAEKLAANTAAALGGANPEQTLAKISSKRHM